jgi:hypothetical protein
MKAPFAAGSWHLVGDGIALSSADIEFSVLWRPAGSMPDQVMLTYEHHFDPNPTAAFDAVAYDGDATAAAFGAAGDLLTLKMEVTDTHPAGTSQWVPNGDGSSANGRFPSLTPPP